MANAKGLIAVGALLLAGCAAQGGYQVQQVASQLPVGTRVEVATPFLYPAGRSTLWFQRGEIKPSQTLTLWEWHCSLDLHFSERSEQAREFTGGSFIVTGIREERLADLGIGAPLMHASHLLRRDDRDSYMVGVIFSLSAAEQPAVRQLRCERRFDSWVNERALTLADVRAAVGRYLAVGAAN